MPGHLTACAKIRRRALNWCAPLLEPAAAWRLTQLQGDRGFVFTYHDVRPAVPDGWLDSVSMATRVFAKQIAFLSRHGKMLTPDGFVTALHEGKLPSGACLITFDDGLYSAYEHALPILQEHGIQALWFLCSGYVTRPRAFWPFALQRMFATTTVREVVRLQLDQDTEVTLDLKDSEGRTDAIKRLSELFILAIPWRARDGILHALAQRLEVADESLGANDFISEEQVKGLVAAGQAVGAHTCEHISAPADGLHEFERQLSVDKRQLEEMSAQSVRYFAYPYGNPKVLFREGSEMVRRAGYDAAFTAMDGIAAAEGLPFHLDRLSGRPCHGRFLNRLISAR